MEIEKKWIQITTLIGSRKMVLIAICLFSPSFTCHVSGRWSSWGGHLTKSWMHEKLFAIKKLHSTLSLVSIHYNESQANLPVDDDDVHFQRWLLELLSASISPMIMAAIKYSSGIERRGTRVIIKTIYLLQIPIKIQEVVFVSFYSKAPLTVGENYS